MLVATSFLELPRFGLLLVAMTRSLVSSLLPRHDGCVVRLILLSLLYPSTMSIVGLSYGIMLWRLTISIVSNIGAIKGVYIIDYSIRVRGVSLAALAAAAYCCTGYSSTAVYFLLDSRSFAQQ